MRGLFCWLVGGIVAVIREVNHANAVMRVPELRARHSAPLSGDARLGRPIWRAKPGVGKRRGL